jgi:nicotinate-nucleotide adenylyltransferase
MRLGVFGGTFDPVHLVHLVLAEQCREQGRLDEVHFVVAARPPHKPQPAASFAQRVEMLTLAISGQPAFRVDEVERDRPGLSYTADTLEELHRRHPDAELVLIVGSDSLHDLPLWYQPARIVQLAELLVAARPDAPIPPAEELRKRLRLDDAAPLRLHVAEVPLMAIASRDVRRRLREGRSVRYLIPRAVEAYIDDKGLYRELKKDER